MLGKETTPAPPQEGVLKVGWFPNKSIIKKPRGRYCTTKSFLWKGRIPR